MYKTRIFVIVMAIILCSIIRVEAETDGSAKVNAQSQINLLDERIEAANDVGIETENFEEMLDKVLEAYEKKEHEKVLKLIGNSVKKLEDLEMERLFKKVRADLLKRKDNQPNLIWLNIAEKAWVGRDYNKAKEYISKSRTTIPLPSPPPSFKRVAIATKLSSPITIDGDLSDWSSEIKKSFIPASRVIVHPYRKSATDEDISATFRVAWDEKNFYLGVEIQDDIIYADAPGHACGGDCVEVWLDTLNDEGDGFGLDDYKFFVAPNGGFTLSNEGASINGKELAVKWVKGSWVVEMAIPLLQLGLSPYVLNAGWMIGFALIIYDYDLQPQSRKVDAALIKRGVWIISSQENAKNRSPKSWGKLQF